MPQHDTLRSASSGSANAHTFEIEREILEARLGTSEFIDHLRYGVGRRNLNKSAIDASERIGRWVSNGMKGTVR